MDQKTTASRDQMACNVQSGLENTIYACSSLTKLSGGVANYVYRGTLITPLPDGSETVVVKHTEAFSASNNDFRISDTRCHYEQMMLQAVQAIPPLGYGNITIGTTRLYHFDPSTNTQIYRDLLPSLDLKNFALTHPSELTFVQCQCIGYALGQWLRDFHDWGIAPEQQDLFQKMRGNEDMKRLKHMINYEMLVDTIPNYEGVLGDENTRRCFEEVRERARREMGSGEGQLIHGDFWSGNILLSHPVLQTSSLSPDHDHLHHASRILVLDWELSHISSPAQDLGQMLAELFCLYHFKGLPAGLWLMECFIRGYQRREKSAAREVVTTRELALKTAIHVGVHLICWGSRVPGWGTAEQVERVVRLGRDLVVQGHEGAVNAFVHGPLALLFREHVEEEGDEFRFEKRTTKE